MQGLIDFFVTLGDVIVSLIEFIISFISDLIFCDRAAWKSYFENPYAFLLVSKCFCFVAHNHFWHRCYL